MSTPAPRPGRHTYAEYRIWPEGERWELIDGIAYDMTPAPSRAHQDVLGALHVQVRQQVSGGPCRVYLAPFDVRLPRLAESDDQVDTVVQPDLSVICDPGKLDDAGCRGAPDWVVEVLSPRTAAKDHLEKRALYERHGVREYWLVHPLDRVLTVYRLEGVRFGPAEVLAASGRTPVAALPGLAIDWDGVFEPDQPGAP
jgi:Uma2 family endonuclease